MNPRFHLDWDRAAEDGLFDATAAYFPVREGFRVTQAEQIITYMLSDDPLRNGQPGVEGLYRIVVSPLIALYEVFEVNMAVRVQSVGFFPV